MTLTHASIEGLLKSLSDNGMSPNTIRAYRSDLKAFLSWAGPMPTLKNAEIVAKQYLNLLRGDGVYKVTPYPATTVRRKISALRAWGRFAGDPNFLSEYRGPKPNKAQPHPLPEGINGVLDMMHAAPTPRHRALVALCGLAGLRVSEARTVTPSAIDAAEMTIKVYGKGSKERVIPMGTTAWHFIEPAWIESVQEDQTGNSPIVKLSDRGARKFLTKVGCDAGLARRVSSHDLRATFATAAYTKTKDLRAVQELLGHSSSQTTEVYTGINMEAMRAAASVI